MKRNVYLKMMPIEDARKLFLEGLPLAGITGARQVFTAEALGRVTSRPVYSVLSSPGYHGAAMDGIAVVASDTYGASEESPVTLRVGENAHPVNTGQPLPGGCNAVIMIEHVHQPQPEVAEITAAAFPFMHVRKLGEDIVAREMILPHHHQLTSADVAALLAAGVTRVEVVVRPRVAIIPTGDELMDWRDVQGETPPAGRIIESNSVFLESLVREAGAVPLVQPRQPDRPEAICEAVQAALDQGAHMVLVNAGASAGTRDYTRSVFAQLGEVLVHGIAAMPGKPTVLARQGDRLLVGTPGYPVSAWVCFDQFVAPALHRMQGLADPTRERVPVVAARKLPSKLGLEEFLRVHLGRVGDRIVATPLKRGAGGITSLTRADGIIRIPVASEGVAEGEEVMAELLRPRQAVERTLVVVGSHDITLDLMADHIREEHPEIHMSASHVGSLAGLVALRDGRSHLGGTHLLDPDSGEYNVSWIQRYLGGKAVRLVTLAHREQGLIVARGNPRGIESLRDLARQGIVFVNRQAGAGTRVLLDHELARLGMEPTSILGYENEEFTHMAVAVQVLGGAAHVGMGIRAAAAALDLDFVPVVKERYDLCIPQAFWEDPRIQALLSALRSDTFRQQVAALGGYDVACMGQVAWEG